MKQMMTLQTRDQLKALSDPFKAEMMMRLLEKPYTGQQLSKHFKVSRAHIHYHLKELERNGLVEIVKKEEKNGIIQKFYESVARGFTPSAELLPHINEVGESSRQMLIQMIETTKGQLLAAPAKSFQKNSTSEDPSDSAALSSISEITATEEQFRIFIKKFYGLINELQSYAQEKEKQSDTRLYHLSAYGFQVEEPMFKTAVEDENKRE